MSKNAGKKGKVEAAGKAASNAPLLENDFVSLANHIVAPDKLRPMVMPSLVPSRCGAVTFPLTVDVTGLADFAIIATPDLNAPLRITHSGTIDESNEAFTGNCERKFSDPRCQLSGERRCDVESVLVDDEFAIPLTSATGAVLTLFFIPQTGDETSYVVDFMAYNTTTGLWQTLVQFNVMMGDRHTTGGMVWANTYTHFAFRASPLNTVTVSGAPPPSNMFASYHLSFDSGMGTCKSGNEESVFDVYVPAWTKVLEAAEQISIPFMDCLVTFVGSTLNNQGAIAVCSADNALVADPSYYEAITKRNFDRYDGRLASEGESEGGAHWHLMQNDARGYVLGQPSELIEGPRGYFGIKGMDINQSVRVTVTITINYYTLDPSFPMGFQKPWGELSSLIYHMRMEVPLVSSNDSHLKKLVGLARRKAKDAVKTALANPEETMKIAARVAAMAV